MAFYGKGGIGKSTVVTNLTVLFARKGKRVLQFGCDPKADSCYSLIPGPITTVMDEWLEVGESNLKLDHFLMKSNYNVDCIEVGGPTPGSGCGGRGITKALELIGDPQSLRKRYDLILFDVLGDVVCGGFSAPMREVSSPPTTFLTPS
jgi:nitrogenase iron protein NifH